MKRSLSALLLLLSFAHLTYGQTKNARERAGLFGPVKSVRLETSKIQERDGQPVETRRNPESIILYDERGNEIEKSVYFNGVFQSKFISTFDGQGEKTETQYNAAGAVTSRSILKFDKSGRSLEYAVYNPNGSLLRRNTYMYDDRGNLREDLWDDLNNPALSARTVYSYDNTGRLTGRTLYGADNVLRQEIEFTGTGSKVVALNGDGSIKYTESIEPSRLSFEYDAHRNWIKRSHRRAIVEPDKTTELIEVTYRKITYH